MQIYTENFLGKRSIIPLMLRDTEFCEQIKDLHKIRAGWNIVIKSLCHYISVSEKIRSEIREWRCE